METTVNNSEQHEHKNLRTLRTAQDFTQEQYTHALHEFKNLKPGRIIRCVCLLDNIDANAVKKDPSLKGKYKDCFFVVVQGPTYQNDKCVSNAIVLKINSNQDKEYQYFFKSKDYFFLKNKISYLSCRSIGLGPNDFAIMHRMKQKDDYKKDKYLSIEEMKKVVHSLRQFYEDEMTEFHKVQQKLQNIQNDRQEEIRKQIEALTKEKQKFERGAENAQRNANLLCKHIQKCQAIRQEKSSNHNHTSYNNTNNKNYNNYSNNQQERERSRDMEIEEEWRHNDNNNFRNNNNRGGDRCGYRGEQGQHYNDNHHFRYNNNYSKSRDGCDMSGYNRGYQQIQPNNYNSYYNQNYQCGRGYDGTRNNGW